MEARLTQADARGHWTIPEILSRTVSWYEVGQHRQVLDCLQNVLVQGNHSSFLVALHAV